MKHKLKNKIVHIIIMDKFIPPFIDFIDENFDIAQHSFIILGKEKYKFGLTKEYDVVWIDTPIKLMTLTFNLHYAEKIIMHGLWSKIFNIILLLQPWVLKKTYWVMWGGDFYFPESQGWIKKQVIKKVGHIIAYVKGDFELAQIWYNTKAQYHECFKYPSNLYKEYDVKLKEYSTTNILLGNSADPTNNHIDILRKLEKYKNNNIKIFVPLSYGDKKYAKKVMRIGKEIFSDKFTALTEFMPFRQYLDFLGELDIAIFAHKRQQAMGNIITLLGLGKKVYIRSDITPWELFKNINVKVFDVENIDLEILNIKIKQYNQNKIKEYFSEENYLKQLEQLFND